MDGNSFGSHHEEEFLPLTWENLEVAQRNLQNIADHHKMAKSLGEWKAKIDEILAAHQDKEWFVKKLLPYKNNVAIDESQVNICDPNEITYRLAQLEAKHCINLFADNGNKMQMLCSWFGQFQWLKSLEIVVDHVGMKIEFN